MVSVQLIALLTLLVCCSVSGNDDRVEQLAAVSKQLARQLMLQQLYVDEQTRANGDSGIKQVIPLLHAVGACMGWWVYRQMVNWMG